MLSLAAAAERSPPTPAELRGKAIYADGVGDGGRPVAFRLITAGDGLVASKGIACVTCHGVQGRGGRDGNVIVPDISHARLAAPVAVPKPPGRGRGAYTDVTLARVIAEGVDPSGRPLAFEMPRWALSGAEMRDLLAYLKRLGKD
jgi:hypothetical protein